MLIFVGILLARLLLPQRPIVAAGVATTKDYYQVGTGAGPELKVRRVEKSGTSSAMGG